MTLVITETSKEEYLKQLEQIVSHLDGTVNHFDTYDQTGRTSKKIVIEYDVNSRAVSR